MIGRKVAQLENMLRAMGGAVIAYSGGADSAFLAEVAHRTLGVKSLAVTADSPSIPRRELAEAGELARARGWRHEVVQTDELDDPRYVANPVDRCRWCKSALMDRLTPISERLGVPVLLGTNADDLGDWRPGQEAARTRGALSPMVEAGLTKAEIREASARIGLQTSSKPAAACLASRFAYGVEVTLGGLRRVERAEEDLLKLGFEVVRVRDLGSDRARVEVGSSELDHLQSIKSDVISAVARAGFCDVHLDERGYRQGALNEGVVTVSVGRRP